MRAVIIREHRNIFIFYIHARYNLYLKATFVKTQTCLSFVVNVNVADGLAKQGSRLSTAKVLSQLHQIISVSPLEECIQLSI